MPPATADLDIFNMAIFAQWRLVKGNLRGGEAREFVMQVTNRGVIVGDGQHIRITQVAHLGAGHMDHRLFPFDLGVRNGGIAPRQPLCFGGHPGMKIGCFYPVGNLNRDHLIHPCATAPIEDNRPTIRAAYQVLARI